MEGNVINFDIEIASVNRDKKQEKILLGISKTLIEYKREGWGDRAREGELVRERLKESTLAKREKSEEAAVPKEFVV